MLDIFSKPVIALVLVAIIFILLFGKYWRVPIDHAHWNKNTKRATYLIVIIILTGVFLTDIDAIRLSLYCIGALSLLLYPWFRYDTPRRYFHQLAPIEYNLVFGWAGIIICLAWVIIRLYIDNF